MVYNPVKLYKDGLSLLEKGGFSVFWVGKYRSRDGRWFVQHNVYQGYNIFCGHAICKETGETARHKGDDRSLDFRITRNLSLDEYPEIPAALDKYENQNDKRAFDRLWRPLYIPVYHFDKTPLFTTAEFYYNLKYAIINEGNSRQSALRNYTVVK